MKKNKENKEKDIRGLSAICIVTALAADVLCVLFLLNIFHNRWFSGFIMLLGILMHVIMALLGFLKSRPVTTGIAVMLVILYGVCLAGYLR